MKKLTCIAIVSILLVALVCPVMAGKVPAPAKCRVDVKSKPVALLGNHLFIVYTNASGSYYYRGGPSGGGVPDWGTIVTDSGKFVPGSVDYSRSSPSVTVASGTGACAGACFDTTAYGIEAAGIPYQLLTVNSNSVIRTLLNRCSMPAVKPAVWAPGWETVLSLP